MKVLDLFCGRGGWSKPFVEDGDIVTGVDVADFSKVYPGKFIQEDIRYFIKETLEFEEEDYDIVCGSPPCDEFSQAIEMWKNRGRPRDIDKGLELIDYFQMAVEYIEPEFWFMENVEYGEAWISDWLKQKPSWHFKISRGGRRCLWSNFAIPLIDQPKFDRSIWKMSGTTQKAERAEIPYPIARFVADSIKGQNP